jgi:hypothetical protein
MCSHLTISVSVCVSNIIHLGHCSVNERANANVKEMLATWLSENNSTQWSEGLRFIQFQKNRSYHRVIEQSPYKALFGANFERTFV